MTNVLTGFITVVAGLKIRFFPFLVAGCVLFFPAYKGIWLGYVPIAVGCLAAIILLKYRDAIGDSVSSWSSSRLNFLLYGFPALIQVSLILLFQPEPWFDGLFVYRHAETLINTGDMDPMTYYPPAQTWWYAMWFSLLEPSPMLAQISQIPLSLGVTWSTYRLGRNLGSRSTARAAALVVAWYPAFLGYVLTTPYYHYLYTFSMVLMVWGLYRFWIMNSGVWSGRWIFFAGLAAGLGALTKAVQLIAPLQLAVWALIMICVSKVEWRRWAFGMLMFVAGMLMVLGPWMLRNWMVFDHVVPVCTSGGLVLYSANNPESNGLYSALPDSVSLNTPAEMLAHSQWCSAQAKEFMLNEPVMFLNLVWKKFLHTWGVEATFTDLINWRGQSDPRIKQAFSFVFVAGWAALVFAWVAVAGRQLRQAARLSAFEALTGVLVLSNALVYVVFEGGDRHHLPLVPLIILLVCSINRHREAGETSTPAVEAR